MTRLIIVLSLCALAVSIAGIPLFLWSGDDSRSRHGGKKTNDGDVVRKDDGGRGMGWLHALAKVARINDAAEFPVGKSAEHPELERLDRAFDEGVVHCAPEIFGYDRKLLESLQSDWHVLKPNLQPSWDAWLQLPGVVVDEEKLGKCQNAFSAGRGDKECAAMQEAWGECAQPFKGTLGEGDDCSTNEQCASSRCVGETCTAPDDCEGMSGCPSGMLCAADETGFHTCVDQPNEGDACLTADSDEKMADTDPNCGAGRVCDSTEHCVTAKKVGERCSIEKPCSYALICQFDEDDEDAVEGRCAVEPPEEPYIPDADDVGVDLVDDDDPGCTCDPYRDGMACVEDPARDRMKCVPVTIVDDGEACDETRLCRGALGLAACMNGTCRPALAVGDACDDHEQCGDDFVCITGQCAMPHRDGQECMDSDDCIFGLQCIDREGATVCGISFANDDPYEPPYTTGDFDGPIPLDDVIIEGQPPELVDEDGNPILFGSADGIIVPPDDADDFDGPVTGTDAIDEDVGSSDPRVDPPDDEIDGVPVKGAGVHATRRVPALVITL